MVHNRRRNKLNREKDIEILEVALEGYVEECIPELDSEFDEYKAE